MNTHRRHPRASRRLFRFLLAPALLALAAALTPELHAQAAAGAPATLVSSELQLVSRGFGRAALVDAAGVQHGSVGWLSSDLGELEQNSAAAERVRVFKRERSVGTALLAVGAAVAAGSLYQYVSGHQLGASDLASAAYMGGGAVAMAGLIRFGISQRNLRAALTLHNQK